MKEQTDDQLVQLCLNGNQDAWVALIRRYRQLIYGVVRSYRLSDEDSADVFQSVCLELFHCLPRLRDVGALRGWLIVVASRQSLRVKKAQRYSSAVTAEEIEFLSADQTVKEFADLEKRHILRRAIDQLPKRCREMIRLLFLVDSPVAYSELAGQLGLATGSIGFIRRRCLNKLKAALEALGF